MKSMKISILLSIVFTLNNFVSAQDSAFVSLSPEEIVSYIEDAKKSIENESYEAATNKLDIVLKSAPKNYEALDFRGLAKMKQEDAKEKVKDRNYTSALEDFTNAIYEIGNILEKAKEREDKVQIRQRMAKIYLNRGIAKMHIETTQDYKLAIDDFDDAYKLDRDNFDIYINRSEAYYNTRNFSKELFDLRRLVNEMENPKSHLREKLDIAELYFKYARAYINDSNDKDAACKYYKKALNLGYMKAERGVKRHCKF